MAGKPSSVLSDHDMKATKYVFDRMVMDKVKQSRLKQRYEELVSEYSETMRKVVSEVKKLEEIRKLPSESEEVAVKEQEETIADLELRLELLDSEIHDISVQMPKDCHSSERDIDDAVNKLLSGMSGSVVKSLLMETFSKFVDVEVSVFSLHLFELSHGPETRLTVIF